MAISRLYLSPGLFGFERIGSYVYFHHLEQGLLRRFADAGRETRAHRVNASPTASIRRRAETLFTAIATTWRPGDSLHLVGHSTGGLDARLLAAPAARVGKPGSLAAIKADLRSITCMNTPHRGTPLAAFFATLSGQRLLYFLSAATVPVLHLGSPPIALTSALLAALPRPDRALGMRVALLDRASEALIGALDDLSSHDLRIWLDDLQHDQAGILQLAPEAMDVYAALAADDPAVVYQCSASWVPAPGMKSWARAAASPWTSASATLFATLHRLTAAQHPLYTCEPEGVAWRQAVLQQVGEVPPSGANDGIVPFRSQLHGALVWAGHGDHLDVVGHFAGSGPAENEHHDWLTSGARFDRRRFDSLLDAVAAGMLGAEG
ncbi:MAG: hypothetical protein Q8P18_23965 [Pseudomonadota bacterium]|nr:hypothetical protein [Pseudomonadota bacterium]